MTDSGDTKRWLRHAWPAVQLVLVAAAIVFFVRLTRGYWSTIGSYHFSIRWELMLLSSLVWVASFAFLVRLWGGSLRWWAGRPLPLWSALRIFVVSNLARYVPGAIWQFAGLAAAAVAEGVSPLAAGSAVLLQQLALLASGILLTAALAPGILGQWAVPTADVNALVLIAVGVSAVVAGAVLLWRPLRVRLSERLRGRAILPETGIGPLAGYFVKVTISWAGYGAAFWIFGRALLGAEAPGLLLAATAYIASYVAGIIAVFAPGGIVVREAALVATLGPSIGPERALVLALASRLWLVGLEIVVAGLFFGVGGIGRGFRRGGTNRPGSLRP